MVGGVYFAGVGCWGGCFEGQLEVDGASMKLLMPLAAKRTWPIVRCPECHMDSGFG